VALTLVVAASLAACTVPATDEGSLADLVPADVAEQGAVLVASDLANPPAGFASPVEFDGVAGTAVEAGEFTGFDVQLVEAAADLLGLRVEWRDLPFAEVLPAVLDEEADLAASAITITAERSADLDFVPYFETGTQWVTAIPNELGVFPNTACGARVAVQAATIQEDDLAARSAQCQAAGELPVQARPYALQSEVTEALLTSRVDAFLADRPAAQWAVREAGGTTGAASTTSYTPLALTGPAYDVQPYGWAFRPDQQALADAFAAALVRLVENGTYDEILEFWSVDEGALGADDVRVVD
jgi:polar amino acid transport system substrate-binding protein